MASVFRLEKDKKTPGGFSRFVLTEDMTNQATANGADARSTNGSIYSKDHEGDEVYVIVVDSMDEVLEIVPDWVDPTVKKVSSKKKKSK